MQVTKCPLCESPCVIKIVSAGDERYSKVDVCSTCGTMYPRDSRSAKGGRAGTAKRTKGKGSKKK